MKINSLAKVPKTLERANTTALTAVLLPNGTDREA